MRAENCDVLYLTEDDINEDGGLNSLKAIKQAAYAQLVFYIKDSGEVKLVKDKTGILKEAKKRKKAKKAEVIANIVNSLKNR